MTGVSSARNEPRRTLTHLSDRLRSPWTPMEMTYSSPGPSGPSVEEVTHVSPDPVRVLVQRRVLRRVCTGCRRDRRSARRNSSRLGRELLECETDARYAHRRQVP